MVVSLIATDTQNVFRFLSLFGYFCIFLVEQFNNIKYFIMKKHLYLQVLFLIAISIGIFSCNNKKADKPEKVLSSFEKTYPNSTNVIWKNQNDSLWEVNFEFDGIKISSEYSNSGDWMQSKYPVSSEQFPQSVIDRIDGFYYDYLITKSELVETPDSKLYEVDIEVNNMQIALIVSEEGGLLQAKKKE